MQIKERHRYNKMRLMNKYLREGKGDRIETEERLRSQE